MPARLEAFILAMQGGAERVIARALRGLRNGHAHGAHAPEGPVEPPAQAAQATELPGSYGHSRVVALAIDPAHVHVYWEVTEGDEQRLTGELQELDARSVAWLLRFHDVTLVDFDGSNAHGHFDIPVNLSARNWYVELWSSNKTYLVELGASDGARFLALARSSPVHVPRGDRSAPEPPIFHTVSQPTGATTGIAESHPAAWALVPEPAREAPTALPVHDLAPEPPPATERSSDFAIGANPEPATAMRLAEASIAVQQALREMGESPPLPAARATTESASRAGATASADALSPTLPRSLNLGGSRSFSLRADSGSGSGSGSSGGQGAPPA